MELNLFYLPLPTYIFFLFLFFLPPSLLVLNVTKLNVDLMIRCSFLQPWERHAKTLDSTGQDGLAVPVGLDSPTDDARHLVLETSKRYLELKLFYFPLPYISSLLLFFLLEIFVPYFGIAFMCGR